VQDLEDGPPHGVLARDALEPGFPLAIPRLDAVLAIDHVETQRQRVHDLLHEMPLLGELSRLDLDFRLERAKRPRDDGHHARSPCSII
jgi:hypothetical protein